jgi:hypothetical protein
VVQDDAGAWWQARWALDHAGHAPRVKAHLQTWWASRGEGPRVVVDLGGGAGEGVLHLGRRGLVADHALVLEPDLGTLEAGRAAWAGIEAAVRPRRLDWQQGGIDRVAWVLDQTVPAGRALLVVVPRGVGAWTRADVATLVGVCAARGAALWVPMNREGIRWGSSVERQRVWKAFEAVAWGKAVDPGGQGAVGVAGADVLQREVHRAGGRARVHASLWKLGAGREAVQAMLVARAQGALSPHLGAHDPRRASLARLSAQVARGQAPTCLVRHSDVWWDGEPRKAVRLRKVPTGGSS